MESNKEYIDLTHQLEFLERTYAETTGKIKKAVKTRYGKSANETSENAAGGPKVGKMVTENFRRKSQSGFMTVT